jgi:hypothetical protein
VNGASITRGYDRFEVVAFPPLLLTVAVGGHCGGRRDFLGLVGYSRFDVGAIHHRPDGGVSGDDCVRWICCRGPKPRGRWVRLRRNFGNCL